VKAVVIEKPNNIAIKQVADPTPSAGQAVVKVEACGV
jgi:D-arabinose 1-dehydrogenase-like Zn-dependent alcohol dehydrogenase